MQNKPLFPPQRPLQFTGSAKPAAPAPERASLQGLDVQDSDFHAWIEAGGELPADWDPTLKP